MSTVAHLAIGTEVLLGQTLNSNSQWLSQKLHGLGFDVKWHVSCQDNLDDMRLALNWLKERADCILVTGGLGPTSDDLTRELIAQVENISLVWNEHAWTYIQEFLGKRGIPVLEMHKKECFFPPQAVVFKNPLGTAWGFGFKSENHVFVVLPGPPREIAAMWDQVQQFLDQTFPQRDPLMFKNIFFLGRAESGVAEIVEQVLQGCPFTKAYRIDLPYVEFKLIFPASRLSAAQEWMSKVEAAFSPEERISDKNILLEPFRLWQKKNLRCAVLNPQGSSYLVRRLSELPVIVVPLTPQEMKAELWAYLLEWQFQRWDFLFLRVWKNDRLIWQQQVPNSISAHHSVERREKFLVEKGLWLWWRESRTISTDFS